MDKGLILSNKLYSVRDFARLARVSEDALRKAIRNGKLDAIKVGPNRCITLEAYTAYKAACRKRLWLKKGVNIE